MYVVGLGLLVFIDAAPPRPDAVNVVKHLHATREIHTWGIVSNVSLPIGGHSDSLGQRLSGVNLGGAFSHRDLQRMKNTPTYICVKG